MKNNLSYYQNHLKELEKKLGLKEILASKEKLAQLAREYNKTCQIVRFLINLKKIKSEIEETKKLINESESKEMIDLATTELNNLSLKKEKIEKELFSFTSPKEEEKNVILEIRAGTGGEEAALFAADLFRMYSRFAEKKNWPIEILSSHPTGLGGFKEIIFKIAHLEAWSILKFESGVHRIQRIPLTEKTGRIHTSTASVAVLPEAEEIDLQIEPKDLKIETFRASGHGGQSVQKTESAVRITHLPTSMMVSCQDERSQLKNKERALKILRSRLLWQKKEEERQKIAGTRKNQIGQAERAEKIRTYNFPQDRITDHRIKKSWHNIEEILNGNLDKILESFK